MGRRNRLRKQAIQEEKEIPIASLPPKYVPTVSGEKAAVMMAMILSTTLGGK